MASAVLHTLSHQWKVKKALIVCLASSHSLYAEEDFYCGVCDARFQSRWGLLSSLHTDLPSTVRSSS